MIELTEVQKTKERIDLQNKVLLNKSQKEFIKINKEYLESIGQEFFINHVTMKNDEIEEVPIDPLKCPLHLWHIHNKTKCSAEFVALTAICPLCDLPMCPTCQNHNVHQLSRVTGYISDVNQWNSAKKQEYRDRMRHTI